MNKIRVIFSTIIIALIFTIVAFFTYNLAEPKAYDFMTKHFTVENFLNKNKKAYGNDNIVLVIIDSKSLEKYRWPWKRQTYCDLFNYFTEFADEKILAYDFIISTLDNENPESDKKFFETLKKFNNLIVGFFPRISDKERINEHFPNKYKLKIKNNYSQTPQLYKGMMPCPKEYIDVTNNVGSVAALPGFINGNILSWAVDEVYRNHQFVLNCAGNFYPSIAMKTFLMLNNDPETTLSDNAIKFPTLKKEIKQKTTQHQSFVPIKFYKLYKTGYSHKHYSAIDVMASYTALKKGEKPLIDPELFKDKIVIIGANVPASVSLNDNKNTPVSINHPGADIIATTIDNIVNDDFLTILPQWLNFIITLLGMITVYLYIRVFNLYKAIFATLSTFITYFILCAICFSNNVVINVITPIVIIVLTMILSYIHKFVLENQNKEKVKTAMGKYMSEDVMKRVVQNIDNLGLGGKKATVTVLFADIRGFTSMSEQMTAQEVSEILNEYFTEMEPIITEHNGIINKFIGDAVMAIFGEPIQDKNHAQNAVKCACKMLDRVKELQKKWALEGKPKIDIGVGINTGEVFVGNIGSINRMEYTVIGDTVNLASRLESYNKTYKTKLLISSTTYEEVKAIADTIKISDVQIRGKANKMDIYEVLKIIDNTL